MFGGQRRYGSVVLVVDRADVRPGVVGALEYLLQVQCHLAIGRQERNADLRQRLGQLDGIDEIVFQVIEAVNADVVTEFSSLGFQAIAGSAQDLIAEVDAHGCLVYASPGFETVLGHPPRSLVGRAMADLVHPDERAGILRAGERLLREGYLVQTVARMRHRDGRWRALESTGRTYLRPDGGPSSVIVLRDVTGAPMVPPDAKGQNLRSDLSGCLAVTHMRAQPQFVALGDMSLNGSVIPGENLAECLQVAFDSGAKRIELPMVSVGDTPVSPASRSPSSRLRSTQTRWTRCSRRWGWSRHSDGEPGGDGSGLKKRRGLFGVGMSRPFAVSR